MRLIELIETLLKFQAASPNGGNTVVRVECAIPDDDGEFLRCDSPVVGATLDEYGVAIAPNHDLLEAMYAR